MGGKEGKEYHTFTVYEAKTQLVADAGVRVGALSGARLRSQIHCLDVSVTYAVIFMLVALAKMLVALRTRDAGGLLPPSETPQVCWIEDQLPTLQNLFH